MNTLTKLRRANRALRQLARIQAPYHVRRATSLQPQMVVAPLTQAQTMEASGWAPRLALLGGVAAAAAAAAAAPPAENGYCDRGPKCHPPSLLGHYHPLAVYQQLLALGVMGPAPRGFGVVQRPHKIDQWLAQRQ